MPPRRKTLLKKAHELATLYDCDVSLRILASNGTFHHFSNLDISEVETRFASKTKRRVILTNAAMTLGQIPEDPENLESSGEFEGRDTANNTRNIEDPGNPSTLDEVVKPAAANVPTSINISDDVESRHGLHLLAETAAQGEPETSNANIQNVK